MKYMQRVAAVVLLLLCTGLLRAQPTNGLRAHYSFNDGTGLEGVSGNNAILEGGVSLQEDRFENPSKAVRLDGKAGSYVNLGANNALKPAEGTISIWMNVEDITEEGFGFPYNPIILAKNTNAPGDMMEAYSLYLNMFEKQIVSVTTNPLTGEEQFLETGVEIAFNEWYHLVLSYDANEMKIYINGEEKSSVGLTDNLVFSADEVLLGQVQAETNFRTFKGGLDDVRIYNRVLDLTEVQSLYNEPSPVTNAPTVNSSGNSNCRSRWVTATTVSTISISPDGVIEKTNYDNSGATNKIFSENELLAEEKGWMQVKVVDFGEKENGRVGALKLGARINNTNYHFVIKPNKTNHWIIEGGSPTTTFTADFEEGAIVRIRRNKNQLLLQQKVNGEIETLARIKNIGLGATQFYLKLTGLGAKLTSLNMSSSMGCPPYTLLKQRLDGTFLRMLDDKLRFQFKQEYAIPNQLAIPFKIYDWKRDVVKQGSFNVNYGTNWKILRTINWNLNTQEYYTLEFEANKEEIYLLRFKTP